MSGGLDGGPPASTCNTLLRTAIPRMGLADRPTPKPSSPWWQLFLIACWVPVITAQENLTWGPPSEEHYINGQLTISPFDFRPGTTLSGAQQCLSFLNGPSVVVTIPCLTPVSGDAGALLDKWSYNFTDHTVRPWGTPEKQPGSLCLEGGSIALGAGNYVDVKVTVAACNPAVETQKWVWDDAFLKIDGSNRWLSGAADRSGQFQLGANNTAAIPINFVLPPYTLIDTYTPQPTLAHALTGPNNVDSSNIGDGAGPCLYGVHRAGSFNTSVQCAAECEKEPRCLGFIFGISQGVGCCYVKAYFPPATSTGFSGYSTYVKGTSAVPGFPALALPTSLPTPAPAPSRPSPSINSPPQSTSNPSNSSSVGPPNSDPLSDGSSSNTGLIVGVTCGIVAAVAVVVCCLAFVCCKRRRRKAPERDSEKESSFGKVTPFTSAGLSPWRPIPASPAASSIDQALSPSWRCFSYDEIRQATSDFAPGNLLGEGAHGRVYRAVLPGGTQVAVKQLKEGPKGLNRRGFADELRALSGVRHRNLAAFRGYCAIEDEQYFLILDLADGGNLDAALHGPNLKAPLNWATRVKIAVAAARGLSYLHDGINPPIIHRDIKSANILLDSRQTALVADFGLARLMEDGDEGVTIQAGGTYGYVAPEYATEGLLTKKLDVYSFGVVLLELLTGVRALHKMRDGHRRSLVDLVRRNFPGFDPLLNGEFPPAEASYMGEIAMTCVAHYESRPDMSDVLRALENLVRGEVREESFFRSSAFPNGTEQPLVNAPFWASSALGGSHSSFSSSTPRPSSSREGSNYTSSTGMALQVTGVSKGR